MTFRTIALFLALAFALTVTTGCKSDEEKACENIGKLLEECEDYAKEGGECSKDMEKTKEECSNFDEVLACAIDAGDKVALMKCMSETCRRQDK